MRGWTASRKSDTGGHTTMTDDKTATRQQLEKSSDASLLCEIVELHL